MDGAASQGWTLDDQSGKLVAMRTISATEFKAKCLAILDEVQAHGETVTVLKHGKPVAQLVPPSPVTGGFPQDALKGTVEILGDVVGPVLPAGEWEAVRGSKP